MPGYPYKLKKYSCSLRYSCCSSRGGGIGGGNLLGFDFLLPALVEPASELADDASYLRSPELYEGLESVDPSPSSPFESARFFVYAY